MITIRASNPETGIRWETKVPGHSVVLARNVMIEGQRKCGMRHLFERAGWRLINGCVK